MLENLASLPSLLYSWRSQYKDKDMESFPGRGNTDVSDESKAVAKLKKEHARL